MQSTPTASETTATSLVAIGDQCVACAAPLAGDQRYCLQCGERRGAPRLPFMDGRTRPASAPPERPLRPRPGPRASAGATLVAGVATLLLAMGVGVLIGRSGHDKTAKGTPAVQVVTVPGGGAAAGAATTAGTATTKTAASAGAKTKKSSHGKSKHAGAATNNNTAAAKKAAPPPTVTVGAPGHGKGYKNGHFTGDFFGQ